MSEFRSINPSTEEVIRTYETINDQQLSKKLASSKEAFQTWKDLSFEERSNLLLKVAQILREYKGKFAHLIHLEMGKFTSEAEAEIEKSAWVCEYYAQNAASFLAPKAYDSQNTQSYVVHDPIGGVLAIMPWNFPFWQVFRFCAPALMAGNTVLLKHAPNVCGSALTIEEIFKKAGVPPHVFQTLIINIEQLETVMAHPHVQGLAITGSEKAGAAAASLAGKNIKRSVLELGGSDPFIVLKDADVEKAAQTAIATRFGNAGQTCIAGKRFLIAQEVYGRFKTLVEDKIEQLILQKEQKIACMARKDLADNLMKQLQESLDLGAKLIAGGVRKGNYISPTLISNVKKGMPAFDEETFGPLMCLTTFETEEEAIALANDSRYGLGASIWSQDLEKATRIASKIESGNVFINSLVKSDPRLPFGGFKASGYGKELSEQGIKEFVNAKTIVIA